MLRVSNFNTSCIDTCMVGEALDGMCVGLVVVSDAGRVLWLNRCAQATLGITKKKEASGQLLAHLLKDPRLADFWHRARETDELMDEVAIQWPRKGALRMHSAACVDAWGSRLGRALILCDVTAERVQPPAEPEPNGGLTPNELRVLRLVGRGIGNREIANTMHVAISTVRTHLKHVYRKLRLKSRAEAVRYAIRHGLA